MGWAAKRYHDISCGHRVHNQGSKCEEPHGHNYRFHFECVGALDDVGRVIDFSDIKTRLCVWLEDNWDHKFIAWDCDPVMREVSKLTESIPHFQKGLVWVPFNPTAENMAKHMVDVIGPQQLAGTGIVLKSCTVDETRKCSASYTQGE